MCRNDIFIAQKIIQLVINMILSKTLAVTEMIEIGR